jgi:ORF6N domain
MTTAIRITEQKISDKIYLLRGKRVMFDFDLAAMYGVETKHLKRQVRRNMERFPEDFMFQLSTSELNILRSQIGTSSWGGLRYSPYAFTEQGVAMLSSILNSASAIQVNIQIIRVFTRMRELISTHKDILLKLEKQLMGHDKRLKDHEHDIQLIFGALKELSNPPEKPRKRIGFKIGNENG